MEGVDAHQIFEQRMNKFKDIISSFERQQLKKLHEKADKEEEYELSKIKNQAKNKDSDVFKKMEDGVKVAEKIFKSRKINECRMKEMKVRFDMIERVQEETKKFLRDRTHDVTAYKALLKKLIKQGLIKLLEEKVELRCLKADQKIVRQVMSECEREFNNECEIKTTIIINTNNPLTEADLGGITLTSYNGRIVCQNTLKARLTYCLQSLLPEIRDLLFHDSDQYLGIRRKQKKQRELQMKKLGKQQ